MDSSFSGDNNVGPPNRILEKKKTKLSVLLFISPFHIQEIRSDMQKQ